MNSSRNIASTTTIKVNNKNTLNLLCKDASEKEVPINITGNASAVSIFNHQEKISEIDVLSKTEESGHLKIYFDNTYKVSFIKNKALTNLQNESLKVHQDAYKDCQTMEKLTSAKCLKLLQQISDFQ